MQNLSSIHRLGETQGQKAARSQFCVSKHFFLKSRRGFQRHDFDIYQNVEFVVVGVVLAAVVVVGGGVVVVVVVVAAAAAVVVVVVVVVIIVLALSILSSAGFWRGNQVDGLPRRST